MKKALLTLFITVLASGFSYSQLSKDNVKKVRRELSYGAKIQRVDKFEGYIVFISDIAKYGNGLGTNCEVNFRFIMYDDGKVSDPMIEIKYLSSDWIFMEEIIFLDETGGLINTVKIPLKDPSRDVLYAGNIKERDVVYLSQAAEEYFMNWANAEKPKISRIKVVGSKTYSTMNNSSSKSKYQESILNFFKAYEQAKNIQF